MTEETQETTEIEIIPYQNAITVELWHNTVFINEKGGMEGDVCINISGKASLDLLIAGLQQVRGMMP